MAILDGAKDLAKNIGGKLKDEAGKMAGKVIDEAGNRLATGVGDKITDAFVAKSDYENDEEKTVAGNSAPEVTEQQQNQAEITDLDQLETKLKSFLDIASAEEENYGKVLVNSLKAQLEVVHAVKNPTMCKSAFDIMIQTLYDAAEELGDGAELRNIQKRAAMMTSNMIFFFDAYLCYQKDKRSKEGQELFKKACVMLADTANGVFQEAVKNPALVVKTKGLSLLKVAGDKIHESFVKRGGLIDSIVDFLSSGKRLEEFKANYNEFILSVVEKIERYKHLFGESVILAELINNKKKTILEITDLDQLETTLKSILDTALEKKETTYGKTLVNSLKAQLEVVHATKNPTLCKRAFDIIIQTLNDATEELGDGAELRNTQKRAVLMISSMILFFDAYLCYQKDKRSKKGQDFLKKACNTLADTANDNFQEAAKNLALIGSGCLPIVAGIKLYENIVKQGGLIDSITDFISNAKQSNAKRSNTKRMEELNKNYNEFLLSAVEKIVRYKHLFGRSIVLAELINSKKGVLSETVGDKTRELKKLDPESPALKDKTGGLRFFLCSVGIFFILLAVFLGFSYLFYLFNIWGSDKWVENLANSSAFDMVFNIHFGILEHPLFIKIIIVLIGYLPTIFSTRAVSRLGFNKVKNIKDERIAQIANEYYTVLANKLDEY